MNELKVFESEAFGQVRTAVQDGQPWFCLADVCRVLEIGNPSDVKNRLSTPCLDTIEVGVQTGTKADGTPAMQNKQMLFVNEQGLYKTIFQSRKPEAEQFTDWVTGEVLPSIRKHGMYAKEELLDNPDLLLDVITKLKAEREHRLAAEEKVKELAPKAEYTDKVLKPSSLLTITTIAKDYGMSAVKLNKLLERMDIQFKQGSHWHLKEKYSSLGYVDYITYLYGDEEEDTDTAMRWTQKGRAFLYERLKEKGVVPVAERIL